MPYAPARPCRNTRCPRTTLAADGYCGPECRGKARSSPSTRAAHQRHYHTTAHRRWRAIILERDPVCKHCHNALSTEADHILTWWNQPDPYAYALDPRNGQGLCKVCHNQKSRKEQAER